MAAYNLTLFPSTINTDNTVQQSTNTTTLGAPLGEVVFIHVYSVVACFAALLFLLTVGGVANVVVILASRSGRGYEAKSGGIAEEEDNNQVFVSRNRGNWRLCGRSDTLRRLDLCNLCSVSLLVCLFLAPLEFATVVENSLMRSVPAVACYLTACSFHFFLTVSVCCLAVLVLEECVDIGVTMTSLSPSMMKVCYTMTTLYVK